ncbi:uncharacterized protein LOC116178163 isoform X2 [Photinus pyralis]|uniref:uncharacterized protein LOC116178163 isoform X2 n=1 Tax=Photinus pyralis TaxID=7054 RepID=UPI001266E79C|nr:uncharacterized protein LOC116178163 isoform X2 [Photinus pyralis]
MVLILDALTLSAEFNYSSTSLRCYTCKSSFNGDCDDVRGRTLPDEGCENSKLVKAFPQAGTTYVCVVHRMAQSDDPNLSVVRGCAPDHYCDLFPNSNECVTCTTSYCNSSAKIMPSIIVSIIGFVCAKLCL